MGRPLTIFGVGAAATLVGLYAVGKRVQAARNTGQEAAPPFPGLTWIRGPVGRLRVLAEGRGGLPVIFVHGLGGRAEQWVPLLSLSSRGWRAAAFDLRGHGASDPHPGGDYRPGALVGDLEAVANGLEMGTFVLVAHSLGAATAAAFAAARPERVAGLLLVDPSGDLTRLPPAEVRGYVEAVAADPHGELAGQFRQLLAGSRPGVAEAVLADLAATPPEVLAATVEAATRESPAAALARYGGPALALLSRFNTLPSSLAALVPGLAFLRVFGTSHWLMLDDPQGLARVLEEFLADVSA